MGDLPLHPGIVHMPIGLVFILPLLTILYLVFYKKEVLNKTCFILIVVVNTLLAGSTYLAITTGENEIKTVKDVVEEKHVIAHEEHATHFMQAVLISLLVSVITQLFSNTKLFHFGLSVTVLMQLVLIFFVYKAGHSGGELVYKFKATDAYLILKNDVNSIQEKEN